MRSVAPSPRPTRLAWDVGVLERARPEALKAHLKSEIDRCEPIIKKAGVQAE